MLNLMIACKHSVKALTRAIAAASLIGLAACVGGPSVTTAPAQLAQATPEVQRVLAPTGVLRVGVYLGSPTSLVRKASGESTGVALELGQALGKALNVPVQVVEYPRVAEVIEGLKAGQVDMTFTNATAARAKDVDFTPALVQLELGLLVPAGSRIRQFADADQSGVRVGVSQGSSSQGVLTQRLTQASVVPVASLTLVQSQLQAGQLDAFATNKGILFELAEKLPGYQVLADRWGLENLAIAVPKGREAGMAYLQNFAQQMQRSGQLQRISQRAGLRGMASSH